MQRFFWNRYKELWRSYKNETDTRYQQNNKEVRSAEKYEYISALSGREYPEKLLFPRETDRKHRKNSFRSDVLK